MTSKKKNLFSKDQVIHVARLAQIPITSSEATMLSSAFSETLAVIEELQAVSVAGVEPTHHVTGLSNITREDVVEENRMFSQAQALANAKQSHQGFFVVPRIIDRDVE